jgi:hypothetical protein
LNSPNQTPEKIQIVREFKVEKLKTKLSAQKYSVKAVLWNFVKRLVPYGKVAAPDMNTRFVTEFNVSFSGGRNINAVGMCP